VKVFTLTTVNPDGFVSVDVRLHRDDLASSYHAAMGGWVDDVEDVTDMEELHSLAEDNDFRPEVSEHDLPTDELHVVALGDAFNGISLVGPFPDYDEALAHADSGCYDGDWHVVSVGGSDS
jgi:hypothetical protein